MITVIWESVNVIKTTDFLLGGRFLNVADVLNESIAATSS